MFALYYLSYLDQQVCSGEKKIDDEHHPHHLELLTAGILQRSRGHPGRMREHSAQLRHREVHRDDDRQQN